MSAVPVTASPSRPDPVRDGLLMAGRSLTLLRRRPASFVGAVVFPAVFLFAFLTVFGRSAAQLGIDYVQYLVPIVCLQALFFAAIGSSVWLAEDARSGMVTRLRSLPVARSALVTGRVLADLVRALVSVTVLLLLATPAGFRFEAGALPAAGFVALALLFALTATAGYAVIGLSVPTPEVAQSVGVLPYAPLLLLSTGFAPAEVFPGWLQPVVRHTPVSATADALRALADGDQATGRLVLVALAWLLPLLLLFATLATRAFRRIR